MPQQLSDSVRYLQWVARNLNHFEFLSDHARELRNDVRRWYYGAQDAGEARQLEYRFHCMFSDNIIQDALSVPFGAIIHQTHVGSKEQQLAGMAELGISYIVGRTIRVYGGPEDTWRDQDILWRKLQESRTQAEEKIPQTVKTLRSGMHEEKRRNMKYGLSGYGLFSTLLLIAFGLMLLFQSLNVLVSLVKTKSIRAVAAGLPAQALGLSPTWCMLSILACFAGALIFVCILPRLLIRLRGGIMWLFQLRSNYKQRQKVCAAIDQGVKQEGLKLYAGKVFAAVQKLKKMPDHFENEDPTTSVLGTNCLSELFEGVCVPHVPPEPAGLESLLADMKAHSLLPPLFLILMAAIFAVGCLPALMSASTAENILEKRKERHMNSIVISQSEGAIDEGYTILRPDGYSSSAIYRGSGQSFTMMALQDGSNDTFWASDDLPAWICYEYAQARPVRAIALASGRREGYGIEQIKISMFSGDEVVFEREVNVDAGYEDMQILRFSETIAADRVTVTFYCGAGDAVYLSQFFVLE